MNRIAAIRGATTVAQNTEEAIKLASVDLIEAIIEANGIKEEDIVMVFLTITADLDSYNATSAIRVHTNWQDVPFFTSQEPHIQGALEKCVRILLQFYTDKDKSEIQHVYLNEAKKLRPDLNK